MDERHHEQFMRLWVKAQPTIAGYVHAMVSDYHQAEDLLQNIAMLLMCKFEAYDENRPFVAWALGFAKNEVISNRRSSARDFLTYHADIMENVTTAYENVSFKMQDHKDALHECLKRLSEKNRRMLSLRYADKLKPQDIAQRLEMSATAVRVALTRLRSALLKCIRQKTFATGGMR